MGYITQATLRELLGNVADTNVTDTLLTEAETFCNGTIDSRLGGAIPPGNVHYGKAVGIAYLLGKVFAQFGNETEKVRDLDFKIAMQLLDTLYTDMASSGALNLLLDTDKATTDTIDTDAITSPLNPNGITVIGAKNGVVNTYRKNALDVITSVP
jgi:hypothetical protein